jgi:hypothetical protein
VTVLYNDIGVGYWLYRGGGALEAVVPTVEVHVNTSLNHRGTFDLLHFSDSVTLTAGGHFIVRRLSIGLAAGCAVTGPRQFDVEGLATLNWRFCDSATARITIRSASIPRRTAPAHNELDQLSRFQLQAGTGAAAFRADRSKWPNSPAVKPSISPRRARRS